MSRRLWAPALALGAAAAIAASVAIVADAQTEGRPVSGECVEQENGELQCTLTVAAPATSTSSTTSSSSTTSTSAPTTAAPTTTTLPPTTTSSTTPPPTSTTSTTLSPTTTTLTPGAACSGSVTFCEDFSNPDAFTSRFVHDVGDYVDFQHHHTDYLIDCCPWVDTNQNTIGDHAGPDPMCGVPETGRTLSNSEPGDRSQYFWQCGPTGPASSHLMTAFDSTGYNVVSFAPARSFTNVTKVCWEVNATDEGGGKWTNMILVPEALYQQFAPRMDYVKFDFNNDNAPGDFNIQQGDHPATKVFGVNDFRGTQFVYNGADVLAHPGGDTAQVTTDKRARYQHCFEKTGAATARLTVARPSGGTDVYNVDVGSAWPTGQVRVIFQDEMYDPPKREGYDPSHVTWHWDNIQITAG